MTKEAIIIDGKKISEHILADLKHQIETEDVVAKLAIILVGDDPASKIYVQNKMKAAQRVGILTELKNFDSDITEKRLLKEITALNTDPAVSGIIIQMPLPEHISKFKVIMAVDPMKDVDGFHPINVGMLYSPYQHGFVPCTARGCLKLIKSCENDLQGKNVVIIGRSNIVGRPLAALLLKEDCSVTICHSKTKNLADITSKADIVISAVGRPKFLTTEYFNSNAIVIDVGINRIISQNKCELVGDVDFQFVKDKVKYITPVPGGVGPMTVAYLLVNTYAAKIELDKL
ncbi:MAG: bifunctional 5,10-methylenetetrahydrofolate dehydrogenase/5,10-methenyltetrahydrofolate cyclohydrolase [Rickettsiaceae bacterium]|nr:bifunctional 5,10-methylenetetrahydrofolate dehydrogenase/5,10-methenyltetrahydrofolate cyclohydrolase [Rickettsiaceae bacterium]MDP5021341.1 bifunctional 5,10-methylenetetrahydrofolate dehydrogenase/5,10-methenyltetrahydrofolate cyclohydrolase [Rickettsiaceae bacterium]MDP5083299.1 bifunctional 5,10-methylenetetrahydrofolate dehydrogenase/5,10-methenyltetrahydrofolate cyclohydrolase [Rickettsiaceae bacterium]